VLGLHGEDMVPMPRLASVAGIPLDELLPKEKIDAMVARTRDGGAEIVKLLKTGSAYYAPGSSVASMAESIIREKNRLSAAAVYLEGEYGINGLFMGAPVILGANGVEKVVEIHLTDEEKAALHHSADAVKKSMAQLKV